ncbi:sir-2.4 [Pristionchus pacificus]|uniref:protein acetyllysine N-acetyltransferase n=1 Tax=Pristionchus pacificus TaxID=54126 RepID=A0A2A6BB77_PRIPA|nr:sir-2.4 [Pristionchus pacificus]|eukprot:PDM63130.1 sir-2.4 [Pristionchus pacificus]
MSRIASSMQLEVCLQTNKQTCSEISDSFIERLFFICIDLQYLSTDFLEKSAAMCLYSFCILKMVGPTTGTPLFAVLSARPQFTHQLFDLIQKLPSLPRIVSILIFSFLSKLDYVSDRFYGDTWAQKVDETRDSIWLLLLKTGLKRERRFIVDAFLSLTPHSDREDLKQEFEYDKEEDGLQYLKESLIPRDLPSSDVVESRLECSLYWRKVKEAVEKESIEPLLELKTSHEQAAMVMGLGLGMMGRKIREKKKEENEDEKRRREERVEILSRHDRRRIRGIASRLRDEWNGERKREERGALMSINYNAALAPYDNKGRVGMEELADSHDELEEKITALAGLLKESKCCFAIIGAGVSTAAGIADFRGPKGVWTMEKEGKDSASIDFLEAKPTLTHYGLVKLEKEGILKWMVSQNVDGLCGRSGFPMDRLAELHGNVFCEKCDRCSRLYYRPYAIPTVGGKLTGRYCDGSPLGRRCRGRLTDFTLDWEGELPEPQYTQSCKFACEADLVLCLGTSLQIVPVGNYPLSVKRNGGKIVTVNLQKTKHEKKADIAIHAKVDQVMERLLSIMELSIDELKEVPIDDPILWSANPAFEFEEKKKKRVKKEEIKEEEPEEKRVKEEEDKVESGEMKEEKEERRDNGVVKKETSEEVNGGEKTKEEEIVEVKEVENGDVRKDSEEILIHHNGEINDDEVLNGTDIVERVDQINDSHEIMLETNGQNASVSRSFGSLSLPGRPRGTTPQIQF